MAEGISPNPLNKISQVYLDRIAKINTDPEVAQKEREKWESVEEEKKSLPKVKMYRKAGNLARKGDPESMERQTKIVSTLNKETTKGYKKAALDKLRDGSSPKHQAESFSDWRTDLREIVDEIESEAEKKIDVKKNIKNEVKINPTLSDAVEHMGGQLLEVAEVEDDDAKKDLAKADQEAQKAEQLKKKEEMLKKRIVRMKMMAVNTGAGESLTASYDPMDDLDFDHDEAEKNRGVSGKNNPKGGKKLKHILNGKKTKVDEGKIADALKKTIADMKAADRKAGLLPGGKDVVDLDVERQRRRKKVEEGKLTSVKATTYGMPPEERKAHIDAERKRQGVKPKPEKKIEEEVGISSTEKMASARKEAKLRAKEAAAVKKVKGDKQKAAARKKSVSAAKQLSSSELKKYDTDGDGKIRVVNASYSWRDDLIERLGGRGYSRKAGAAKIHPTSGDWPDSDRGEGNKAARRAGKKVEKKSPSYLAHVHNKEEVVLEKDLNAAERRALPDKEFALPGKGKGPEGKQAGSYPIPDKSHARMALAMVAKHGTSEKKAKVRAAVAKKFPGIKQEAASYETVKKGEVLSALKRDNPTKKKPLSVKDRDKIADKVVRDKGDTSKSDDRYAYEEVQVSEKFITQAKDRKKLGQDHTVSGRRRDHSHEVDSALTDYVPRKGKGRMRPASKKEMRTSAMREDKAFDNVVGKLRKKYGKDAVLTKDSPKPKAQPQPKAKPQKPLTDKEKAHREVVARYGGEANYKAGRGLGT